jgi:hypothetical protein
VRPPPAPSATCSRAPSSARRASSPRIGQRQDAAPQVAPGLHRRAAGDEGLARGGGLARVLGQRRVADDAARSACSGRPSASAAICAMHGGAALADVHRAVEQRQRAVARQHDPHAGGLDMEVLPQPYHMQAMPAPRRWRVAPALCAATRASMRPSPASTRPGIRAARLTHAAPGPTASRRRARWRCAAGSPSGRGRAAPQDRQPTSPSRRPPAARRSRGRRLPACRWCRRRASCCGRWGRGRGRRHGRARGSRPSAPSSHRRPC